ncbi:MAG: ferredoxin family protein, partial [Xanthomonadales bacterium]|nr:ferredoxin family protein [Xanthomonadales bacterium]
DRCVMCKHTDCADVCPVDCFYEGENMMVIDPDECIDCGICEPECPETAIFEEADIPDESEGAPMGILQQRGLSGNTDGSAWVAMNALFSKEWPNRTETKESLPTADEYSRFTTVGHKMQFFSPKPAR